MCWSGAAPRHGATEKSAVKGCPPCESSKPPGSVNYLFYFDSVVLFNLRVGFIYCRVLLIFLKLFGEEYQSNAWVFLITKIGLENAGEIDAFCDLLFKAGKWVLVLVWFTNFAVVFLNQAAPSSDNHKINLIKSKREIFSL